MAVSDTDTERAQVLAEETGAQPYNDWRAAIQHDGVTVVSQCVPSFLHADVTCFAAESGRHVFGEKPLALTLEQGARIVEVVSRTGIVFMPCFQYRDRWLSAQFRQAFGSGGLGSPVVLRTAGLGRVRPKIAMHRQSMNGGPLIDMACHFADLLRWITGEEPQRVYATGRVFGQDKAHLAGVEDLAVDEASVEVTYSGDHQLQLYLNWGMPEEFEGFGDCFLAGPNGMMKQDGSGIEAQFAGSGPERLEPPDGVAEYGLQLRIERFVRAVRGEELVDITCADGMIALQVSHVALASIDSGEAVELTPL